VKKSLVIVESPSKAKTIHKFLGREYTVKASVGHIKNLPKDTLGVDIEHGYVPQYITIEKQKRIVAELKRAAAQSDKIYLATDPDREGEAIAWHIAREINTKNKAVHRALFNEITQNAVVGAIKNPLEIDGRKVEAQQARRVMDRLVGYKVSPILWKAVYKGSLSAGRVQSVALRLICEREEEIRRFVREEYWTIDVLLDAHDRQTIKARLVKYQGKKVEIPDGDAADTLIGGFRDKTFTVTGIEKKRVRRNPHPPFITSTLQQEASTRLGFSPAKTMLLAQQLYEGVEIGAAGSVGLITYMRTDSTRFSKEALAAIRKFIRNTYGSEYVPKNPNIYKTGKKAKVQDAHEGIRPTYFDRRPETVRMFLNADQHKLYRLIWNRAIACQMTPAAHDQTVVTITAGDCEFKATGRELVFPGFLKVWEEPAKNNGNSGANARGESGELTSIPAGLKTQMALNLKDILPEQHFTQPPPRYSESSLVKELDHQGIGRPSTYALIISTLSERKYVRREKKRLVPTELGEVVNKIVINHFPSIFNVNFTAKMETELDQIESGKKGYVEVLGHFYQPFRKNLEKVLGEVREIKKTIEEKAGFACEKCGRDMVVKWGRFGKFYACSGFPECKNIMTIRDRDGEEPAPEKAGFPCPECGADMVVRTGKYGKFYACSAFPKCTYTKEINSRSKGKNPPEKAGFTCEKCGRDMVVRYGRKGKFYACSGYPACRNTVSVREQPDGV